MYYYIRSLYVITSIVGIMKSKTNVISLKDVVYQLKGRNEIQMALCNVLMLLLISCVDAILF